MSKIKQSGRAAQPETGEPLSSTEPKWNEWHVYKMEDPYVVGWGWCHLETVPQANLADCRDNSELVSGLGLNSAIFAVKRMVDDLAEAKKLAAKYGWDGTLRGEVHLFWLPTTDGFFVYGFAWQQAVDCTTFLISPIVMPWLGFEEPREAAEAAAAEPIPF